VLLDLCAILQLAHVRSVSPTLTVQTTLRAEKLAELTRNVVELRLHVQIPLPTVFPQLALLLLLAKYALPTPNAVQTKNVKQMFAFSVHQLCVLHNPLRLLLRHC